MKNLLTILAVLMIACWLIAILFFHPFAAIHALLVGAGFLLLIRIALHDFLSTR
jgi:hypothetical protein